MSKNEIKKILFQHGEFDLDKILDELINDYKKRGICLFSSDNKYYFKLDNLRLFNYTDKENKKPLKCRYGNTCNNFLPSTSYKSRN